MGLTPTNNHAISQLVEEIFRQEGSKVLAALIGRLGDFELAQDVLQEAFVTALERWPHEGVPVNPAAWLVTTARHRAIDRLRRASVGLRKQKLWQTQTQIETEEYNEITFAAESFPDERLKLIFTCCHPALNLDARVALTLHTLGGLTTPEIALAFLVPETTMAQRLVRAKRKIKEAGIAYAVPPPHHLNERLDGVLAVLYLIFNAGYNASLGQSLVRPELCAEAIRMNRALISLLQNEPMLGEEPEVLGLLALMLLHDSRREARTGPQGEMIVLEEQDRTRWNRSQIVEGHAMLDSALALRRPGPYQIQAAISALHSQAAQAQDTDWYQISMLYAELVRYNQSPVVRLNWAVAVAMATTPARGLEMLTELEAGLQNYYLFHAARADLLRRAENWQAAQVAYRQALSLTQNGIEQAFLQRRLDELQTMLS